MALALTTPKKNSNVLCEILKLIYFSKIFRVSDWCMRLWERKMYWLLGNLISVKSALWRNTVIWFIAAEFPGGRGPTSGVEMFYYVYTCGKKTKCGFRMLIFCEVSISTSVPRLRQQSPQSMAVQGQWAQRISLMDTDIPSNTFESSKKELWQ